MPYFCIQKTNLQLWLLIMHFLSVLLLNLINYESLYIIYMNIYNQRETSKILRKLNENRLRQYMRMPKSFRKDNGLPLLVSSEFRDLNAPFKVMLYSPNNIKKTTSHGSYPKVFKLCNLLENKYVRDLGRSDYDASYLYKALLYAFLELEASDIGFIPNYLIKTGTDGNVSRISQPASTEFDLLDIKEYVVINPSVTLLLTGNMALNERASHLFMNNEKLLLSKENPVRIHNDFRGKPVIHTYHPNSWHNLATEEGVPGDERILGIIEDAILKAYTAWKNVNDKTSKL